MEGNGKKALWWIALLLCAAAAAVLSGYAATSGAILTGLPTGGWGLQLAPFLAGGWALGTLLALFFLLREGIKRQAHGLRRLLVILLLPPLISFALGAVVYPVWARISVVQVARAQEAQVAAQARHEILYAQIKADPEIVLREEWFADFGERRRALVASLSDAAIPYSKELLRRLYEEAPSVADLVFRHPACGSELLVEHFAEAWERAKGTDYRMLASIVSNPHTPLALVAKVAAAEGLPVGAVNPARRALQTRQDAAATLERKELRQE